MVTIKRLSPEKRKQEIMEAGAKIFVEKGFANTTMEDVIGATTMSKGGVYYYYKSTIDILHDLMVRGIEYRNEIIKSYISEYCEGNEVEFLAKRLVEKMLDDNPYMEIYVQFLIEKKRDEKLSALFEELKEKTKKELSNIIDNNSNFFLNDNTFDFITDIINSIIVGADVLEARERLVRNRKLLEKIVSIILKEEDKNESVKRKDER